MASPSSSTVKNKELEEKKEENNEFEIKKEKNDNESEEKTEEDYKGKEKSKQSENSDKHVKLDDDLIQHLQNMKNWQQKKIMKIGPKWSVTEEEIEEMSMERFDFDYVLKNHLLDEEIVWDDDVWGLQNIIKIPTSHAKKD